MKFLNSNFKSPNRGFSFIDVLVGTAIVLIVFLGIFGAFQLGLKVVGQSQNKITATAIANQWVEKMRNLPYGSLGTVGAVLPSAAGILDPATTTTMNDVEYSVEVGVKYISDPADGSGADDTCGLDYKRAEVRVLWSGRFSGEVKLVTDISPKDKLQEIASCEAQPGGLLSVSVFDAFGEMVSSPLIEVFNPETEELVDSYSPASGVYDFPLATSSYKVMVSKTGYSTDRTYGIEEVAAPEKPHPLILEGKATELSFAIDRISSFSVETLSPWGRDYFSDSFENTSKISQLSGLTVGGGEVRLATDTEGYLASGYMESVSVSPVSLLDWEEFAFGDTEPFGTDLKYRFYYASGTEWYLVPEESLTGNLAGFDVSPVDLSGLSSVLYSRLKIGSFFSTDATATTPILYDWQLSWITDEATPIPNVTFLLQGTKLIGTDGDEQPVYKYSIPSASNSFGHININNLEWDSYNFSLLPGSSLDLVEANPAQPISLPPDTQIEVDLFLESEDSLLLTVQDVETLEPIFSASTTLAKAGYENNQLTDEKGQTYFIPLSPGNYNLAVEAPGYLPSSTSFWVSGDAMRTMKLQRTE